MKSERLGTKPVGAVMVVGAGIAGVQAALDLADAGFYVYVVEAQPAIGPDADYSVRNIVGIVQAAPELAKRVVRMRQMTANMLESLRGKRNRAMNENRLDYLGIGFVDQKVKGIKLDGAAPIQLRAGST